MLLLWIGFLLFAVGLLAFDLLIVNRRSRVIPVRNALQWSAVWILMGFWFSLVIAEGYANHRFGLGAAPDPIDGLINDGPTAATKYLTAYILEKALSIDNLFVIALIFRALAIPPERQHRILMLGVLGAMVLRGLMIGLGVELVRDHHWVIYVMGVLLLWAGIRVAWVKDRPADPSNNLAMRIARRVLPLTPHYKGQQLLMRENGRWLLTPLALALALIEIGDAVFAVDSIPAAFGVTADPLLIYTSNILAIFGLRALYFALAGILDRFRFMKISLSIVLLSVGAKMIAGPRLSHVFNGYLTLWMLIWIAMVLGAGVVASILFPASDTRWQSGSINIAASSGSAPPPT